MASRSAIERMFAYFVSVGLPAPLLKNEQTGMKLSIESIVDGWEVTFPDIRDEELLVAAVGYAQVGKFWPTPSEVRAHCPSLKKAALSLAADNALTGKDIWPSVLRQAGSIGRNERDWAKLLSERLQLPAARLKDGVESAGGWLAICNATHDAERASMGRRFAAAWSRQAEAKQAAQIVDFMAESRKRLEAKRGH